MDYVYTPEEQLKLKSVKPENKGLRFNEGKLKWSLIDLDAFEDTVRVLEYGAHKYTIFEDSEGNEVRGADIPIEDAGNYKVLKSGKNNWKKGLSITETLDSMQRHINALRRGEDIDPESGLPHKGHLGCNVMFLNYMLTYKPEMDDRELDINKIGDKNQ